MDEPGIVSCTHAPHNAPMHIVVIAWLFVTFTMALTMKSGLMGVALFAGLGVAPVLLLLAVAARRFRSRGPRGRRR